MAERTPDAPPPAGGAPTDPVTGAPVDRRATEGVGESTAARAARQRETIPEPEIMPRWVPVIIGLVLVSMAGLAVFTGFRFRPDDFSRITRRVVSQTPAGPSSAAEPQDELDAGGSRVVTNSGAPPANKAVTGSSRAVITGGAAGVNASVRMWARRGMMLRATPPDAQVYVNEMLAGNASQFDTVDEIYEFAQPGSYTIRVTAPGHVERQYVVTAVENAEADVATIDVKLERQ